MSKLRLSTKRTGEPTVFPTLALDVTALWGYKKTGIQRVMWGVIPHLAAAAARRHWDLLLVRQVAQGLEELTRWTGDYDAVRVTSELEQIATCRRPEDSKITSKFRQFFQRTSRAVRQAQFGGVVYAPLARRVRGFVPTAWRKQVRTWFRKPRALCTTADAYLSFSAGVLPSQPPPGMPLDKAIFVLHDLIPLHHAHYCSPELVSAFAHNMSRLAFSGAATRGRFVTASRHVAQDIHEFFHAFARQTVQVDLTAWGYDAEAFFPEVDPAFRQRLGIPADALLVAAVSTQDPRKRFTEIQAAVQQLNAYAVFVGHGQPRREGNAIYLGYASDDVVRQVYSGSDVVVNWSAVEGFGLSTIEALACGARVVIPPDNPISREVGGDKVITAATADIAGLCAAIVNAASAPHPQVDLSRFCWLKSARIFEELLWPCEPSMRSAA